MRRRGSGSRRTVRPGPWRREPADGSPTRAELLASVRAHHPAADLTPLELAHAEAEFWHRGQLRRSGAPMLTHCVSVAAIVAGCGMPPDVVCAALLHDLEDTACPPERVAELFGSYVAELVRALPAAPLPRPAGAPDATGSAPSFEAAVLVIRLADRLHNMRTIAFLSRATRYRKARETVDVLAPLARAAGLPRVGRELHDLSSAVLRGPVLTYAVTGRTLTVVALLLPSRRRARWREEWTAELTALPTRRDRARYTLRVLLGTPRLSLTLRRPVGRRRSS
ncbi:HD domain-containing protein [Streptomyces sp. NPDC059785]|uniref:HD domain-containing protein n=1 Tax=unclassified Streptomyces TaxID=2593676 RepID=UPI00364CBD01